MLHVFSSWLQVCLLQLVRIQGHLIVGKFNPVHVINNAVINFYVLRKGMAQRKALVDLSGGPVNFPYGNNAIP
jgi:hypothetical protein